MPECEYCLGEFSSKSAVNYHKKTARYCLGLRNKECEYLCDNCNKYLALNINYKYTTINV